MNEFEFYETSYAFNFMSLLSSLYFNYCHILGDGLSTASKGNIPDTLVDATGNLNLTGISATLKIPLKTPLPVDPSHIISKADTKSPSGSKVPVSSKTSEKAPSKLLSSDPMLASMLMHRLFAGASSASAEDVEEDSIFNSFLNDEILPHQENVSIINGLEVKEKEILIESRKKIDFENPKYLVDFDDNVEPRDRFRWARMDSLTKSTPSSTSSDLLESSSTTLVTPSCDGYLQVKVTGGWMKKTQEKTEQCLRSNKQIAVTTAAKGAKKGVIKEPLVEITADATILPPPIDLSIEERVRQIAANKNFNSIEYTPLVTLSNRYKRKLLESVTSCTYSAAHKKKSSTSDTKALPSYHNKSLDSPLLFYLPSNNGLSASCVSCAPVPLSLHDMCSRQEMCGFCLTPFLPGELLLLIMMFILSI